MTQGEFTVIYVLIELFYSLLEAKMSSGRGRGQGRGGQRQGIGGPSNCRCPNCGETVPHQRGVPCLNMTCPKCGAKMIST